MIPMERSLSTPAPIIHPSPPASPTTSRPTSRSPDPSRDSRRVAPRRRRRPSRSSDRHVPLPPEANNALPFRRSEEIPRDAVKQHQTGASASKKPFIDQASGQITTPPAHEDPPTTTPPRPSTSKSNLSRPLLKPLLDDVSMYTNPCLNVGENEGTTLEELAHLVRLSRYQERKRANTRVRLQRSLISTALSARLTRCGDISLRNAADCFREDDPTAFANLFGAIDDVRNSCDATRRFALLEPEMDPLHSPAMRSSESLESPTGDGLTNPNAVIAPFLNEISASARDVFLNFLTQLRTNPDYLATRLCALTQPEQQALTVFHQGLEPIESVLPYPHRSSGRAGSGLVNRSSAHGPNGVERLLSFQRHDPLSALIYTCFANPASPDSAEDKRRTTVWATACARLISTSLSSTKNYHEHILFPVLNAWSAMRDWSGRSNMELFLMKILEDGAFLLDRAEDPKGTRFNISDWTPQDNIAAQEFYDQAIDELFEILDDEDATGIPEGAIELGNEILNRLDSRTADSTRLALVYRWLFASWLPAVVIHPEGYGMMAEYHITAYGRQKILKHVALRAQQLVYGALNPKMGSGSPSPKIRCHIDNILNRFRRSSSQRTARLLPARSITSLRETVEVHPYLVISPADLLTLVNALFPERRPRSAHSSSIRSGAPSISGFSSISQPISIGTSRNNLETASVLSMSASSVLSDVTTSREPLLESNVTGTPQRYSPPVPDAASQKRLSNYEDDGYQLRLAMHEMVQILGSDFVAGSCHPCAERWAVLFVSSDGKSLSTHMTYDPDDDPEEDNSSSTSDTEDDEVDEKPDLDKDYHQLRDSVLKLVEDFEIPQGLEDSGTRTTFSNRASSLKTYRSKNKIITPEKNMGSRNPYRRRTEGQSLDDASRSSKGNHSGNEPETPSVLVNMLTAASSQSRVQSDFVSAHLYWKTLQQLNALASESLRKNGFATLLNIFSRGPRDSIRRSASAIEEYDAWLVWLKQSQERHEGLIETMMKRFRALRDKMWYVTGVIVSKHYEHTRKVCSALKIMGVPRRRGSFGRTQTQTARSSALNFIHLEESQMLDLLAASEEQGGPNKLSDDQAEKTRKWLEQSNIQNFCQGEERIHRFCCEIDSCLERLVGDSPSANPVLWSSVLYARDRKTLEGPRKARDRESVWGGDDTASMVSSDPGGRRLTFTSNRPTSFARDLRSMASVNFSQMSIDSGRNSFSRASMSDILDAGDYFGVSSPVHTIDSSTTFWSPFHSTQPSISSVTSRAQSPTTSVTNFSGSFHQTQHHPLSSSYSATRPGTSASSNETIHLQQSSVEKERFLSDLRQTLLSLLLSDLGNFVYAPGSETDSWFGEFSQECIDRRQADERYRRRVPGKKERSSKVSTKQRVIEKKKSSINLREANEGRLPGQNADRLESPATVGNDSSATSDTVPSRPKATKKDDTPDFPYRIAYQRLLRTFSVHPNPHTKLHTLLELEQLIIASLSSGRQRSRWTARSQFVSNEDSFGTSGRTITLDPGTHERRPTTFQSLSELAESRSVISVNPATKEAIGQVIQSLFKDSGVRPKTLFRDLQFINAFVSQSVLDTEQNNAFWNIGLAAHNLKQEVVTTMVEIADEAVAQSQVRPPSSATDNAGTTAEPPLRSPPTSLSIRDAAKMLIIAAKEGSATAQREWGLLHLSNPEVVEKTTLPLSKPREVFKQSIMEKFGSRPGSSLRHPGDQHRSRGAGGLGGGGAGGAASGMQQQDAPGAMVGDVRVDPALMCVALHWMEAAENGGDELAKRFFTQQKEMMGLG